MPKRPSLQDVHEPVPAQLFTLRLWREELDKGYSEWRGKVQHVTSGEVRYFRDWPALVACLQEMLNATSDQT